MHPSVHCVALFTATETWKQPKCPLTEEWIKKVWYICAMEYYSATENNELMPFAATWRLLYSVKLIKTKIMYHLYVESRKKK